MTTYVEVTKVETTTYRRAFPLAELEEAAGRTLAELNGNMNELLHLAIMIRGGFEEDLERHGDVETTGLTGKILEERR